MGVGDRRPRHKSDIDEDDLRFFEQDDNTHIIAQHCEDLKDGRVARQSRSACRRRSRWSSEGVDARRSERAASSHMAGWQRQIFGETC
jgi:acyl-CoA synthetase (NDP forming)